MHSLASAGRQENPLGFTVLLVAGGLAFLGVTGTVGGIIIRRKRINLESEAAAEDRDRPPRVRPGLTLELDILAKALVGGGGAGASCEGDEKTMRQGGLFTCFFNRETESDVLSRLQAYKNDHDIESCSAVTGTLMDGEWPVKYRKYFREAEQATREILTQMYPSGAPWGGDQFAGIRTAEEAEEGGPLLGSVYLWRWWLWRRVIALAEVSICNWHPIT